MLIVIVGKAAGLIINFFYNLFLLFPQKNQILILSKQDDKPSEDIELLTKELEKTVQVRILCRKMPHKWPALIKYLFFCVQELKQAAISKAIVLDGYSPVIGMIRRTRVPVIQIWHAAGAIKKFGYAALGKADGYSEKVARNLKMYKNYDVIFIGSEACREQMVPAFGCDEETCVVAALPRMDKIINHREEYRQKIYEAYPQIKGKYAVLYAPTFRKTIDMTSYFKEMADAADRYGYCLLVKTHVHTTNLKMPENVIHTSGFSCTELLCAADSLVTDYSSVVFESALAGVPIYFYRPDLEVYIEKQGIFDIDVPAFASADAGEVVKAIDRGDYDKKALKAFAEKYIDIKENNTKYMADIILERAGI